MNRTRRALARIASGSGVLLRHLTSWWLPGQLKTAARRTAGLLALAWLLGGLLLAAPFLCWWFLAVWLVIAYRVSDSSATPPPLPSGPARDIYAGDTGRAVRVDRSPEGVMCIVHPEREEVNDS